MARIIPKAVPAAILLAAGMGASVVRPSGAASPPEVALGFAGRLAAALEGTPADWDRLWAPGARDSTRRLLDLRTAAMFDWSRVVVEVEDARATGGARGPIDVTFVVRGTATWDPEPYGVARAFWALQLDEIDESNRVVRREAWRLVETPAGWRARERVRLAPVEILDVSLTAGVYPAQDALLVECAYYVRSLVDDLEVARFLLDRRARIYRLIIDGRRAEVMRGGELGSLGLEGFSSESESTFRFPEPLGKGEEALLRFRIRSPLVHMQGDGFVTTLPIRPGPFRERVWYPVPMLDHLPGARGEDSVNAKLVIRFPEGAYEARTVLEPEEGAGRHEATLFEEDVLVYRMGAHYRDLDFFLVESGADLEDVDWSAYGPFATSVGTRLRPVGPGSFLPTLGPHVFGRTPEDDAGAGEPRGSLDPHPRSRHAIVDPLLEASTYSTRDLVSELEELLPLDLQQLDEFFDDSSSDADEGQGEPSRD